MWLPNRSATLFSEAQRGSAGRSWALVGVGLLLICSAGLTGCQEPPADDPDAAYSGPSLVGAGATFPQSIYMLWSEKYQALTDVHVNYQPIGSGGGVRQIQKGTVDFGASDAPLKPEELIVTEQMGQPGELLQFPMVIGGVVPVVNLPGLRGTQLRLDPETLVDLLSGEITRWNDPRVQKLNPGVPLPGTDVTVVYRADPAGTTWIFTKYLTAVSPRWAEQFGAAKAIDWPTGMAGKGNQGVATYVSRVNGAIGYVDYAVALETDMQMISLQNSAGKFVQPSIEAFQAAASNADWTSAPAYYVVLVDQPGAETWPITGASFILIHREQPDLRRAQQMLGYFQWCLDHGATLATDLDFVPLPENVVQLIKQSWRDELTHQGEPFPLTDQ